MRGIWGKLGIVATAITACVAAAVPASAATTRNVQIVCGKHLLNGDAWYGNCSSSALGVTYSMFWDGNVPRCALLAGWEDRDLGLAGPPYGVDYDNIHVGC
ncbi:hypothetical protein [Kutzneria kofuensis]|uniref:Alpha amylase inhibitor n=1 Tax=Kutzneria kofuensis TaxID=103725 RepID=A0A7W9KQA3_9PSEU|nr:hypothetical protein [Kutzneria kofuensis]MBB5896667.1 hypothetical protein [Kutzneria kofuensis]